VVDARGAASASQPGRPREVATATQIADFARAVAGDRAHVAQPLHRTRTRTTTNRGRTTSTPEATTDVVLVNGDNLDRWADKIVQ
jgi:zinc/manganese transport system substrate-binding protein/manganese/iron transport system substrate-binding protein